MHELNIVPQVLVTLLQQPGSIALIALLLTAAVIDVRNHRIPNWLTGGGTVIALAFAAAGVAPQQEGLLSSLGGMAAGLAMLLPMYLLRVMGAGDVKLMAMVGAFVGLSHIVPAVLFAFMVGGVAAIFYVVANRRLVRFAINLKNILTGAVFSAAAGLPMTGMAEGASVGKLPYGVSIGAGTILYLAVRQLGFLAS
jgi:prepilin peptidase CpaA